MDRSGDSEDLQSDDTSRFIALRVSATREPTKNLAIEPPVLETATVGVAIDGLEENLTTISSFAPIQSHLVGEAATDALRIVARAMGHAAAAEWVKHQSKIE